MWIADVTIVDSLHSTNFMLFRRIVRNRFREKIVVHTHTRNPRNAKMTVLNSWAGDIVQCLWIYLWIADWDFYILQKYDLNSRILFDCIQCTHVNSLSAGFSNRLSDGKAIRKIKMKKYDDNYICIFISVDAVSTDFCRYVGVFEKKSQVVVAFFAPLALLPFHPPFLPKNKRLYAQNSAKNLKYGTKGGGVIGVLRKKKKQVSNYFAERNSILSALIRFSGSQPVVVVVVIIGFFSVHFICIWLNCNMKIGNRISWATLTAVLFSSLSFSLIPC